MNARRWLARAVVSVAAALSVSVGVTSLPAQALQPPPPVPPGVVVGGVRVVAPLAVEAGIACAATVVCAAGVATIAVGAGLYATRDTWIPWVQGLFADEGTSNQGPAAAGKSVILESFVVDPSNSAAWSITARNTGQSTAYRYWQVNQICRVGTAYSTTTSFTTGTLNAGQSFTLSGACGPGAAVVALLAEPYGADPAGWPANFPKWTASGAGVEAAATYRATAQCVKPDGTTQNVTIEYTGTAGGFIMPSCSGRGLGDHMKAFWLDGILPGSTAAKRIWQTTPVAEAPYPACDPAQTAQGCMLEVHVDGSRCLVGDARCLEWTRHSETRLECHYGPYTVVISRCYTLERAYVPGGAPLTRNNTDGNPETWDKLNPDNSVSPGTNPGTGTGGGTLPDPSTWPGAAGSPEAGSEGGECFPSGWAVFNPVEWVYRPIVCAFKPNPDTFTARQTQLRARIETVGVGPLITAVGGNFSSLSAGGCSGPTMNFDVRSVHQSVQPFNACSAPMSTVAGFTRALASVVIIVAGGLAFVRALAAGFGFNFSMRAKGGGDEA